MSKPTSIRKSDLEVVEKGNMPGLKRYIEIVEVADVLADGTPNGVKLEGTILLMPGANFARWEIGRYSGEVKSDAVNLYGSTAVRNSLTFTIPTNREEALKALQAVLGKKVMLICDELNGQKRILGSKLRPARIVPSATSGQTPNNDKNQVAFDAVAFSTGPAWIYTATVDNQVLDPISSLSISPTAPGTLRLDWEYPAGETVGSFLIGRGTDPSGPFAAVATVGAEVRQYTDSGLADGQVYYYEVKAGSFGTESDPVTAQGTTPVLLAVLTSTGSQFRPIATKAGRLPWWRMGSTTVQALQPNFVPPTGEIRLYVDDRSQLGQINFSMSGLTESAIDALLTALETDPTAWTPGVFFDCTGRNIAPITPAQRTRISALATAQRYLVAFSDSFSPNITDHTG